LGGPDAALKPVEIVADRHGKGQELLERLLGAFELDRDPALVQADTGRQLLDVLVYDLDWSLDQERGMFQTLFLQLGQGFAQLSPSLALVIAVVAPGKAAQTGNQSLPIRQPVCPDAIRNARGHDLLSAAASDAEEKLDGGAIDERAGKGFQFPNDLVDFAEPSRFLGHGCLTMLVRTCAKYNQQRKIDKKYYLAFVLP
jgi:hypothetical protein